MIALLWIACIAIVYRHERNRRKDTKQLLALVCRHREDSDRLDALENARSAEYDWSICRHIDGHYWQPELVRVDHPLAKHYPTIRLLLDAARRDLDRGRSERGY